MVEKFNEGKAQDFAIQVSLDIRVCEKTSHTGTRTRVSWVRAMYPNHLDYMGIHIKGNWTVSVKFRFLLGFFLGCCFRQQQQQQQQSQGWAEHERRTVPPIFRYIIATACDGRPP